MKYLSQQRQWQLRMLEKNKCIQCGGEKDTEIQMCSSCREKHKEVARKYYLKKKAGELKG